MPWHPVQVISLRKPFSSFKMVDGLDLMGIKRVTESPTLSDVAELDLDEALPERITTINGWKTIQVGTGGCFGILIWPLR